MASWLIIFKQCLKEPFFGSVKKWGDLNSLNSRYANYRSQVSDRHPPRVYEFPEYLVIDRPFSFTDTDFVYGGLTSGESLQLSLSCEGEGDHYRVLACVTQGGVARSKILIVGTCIGGREYFKGKTNPQGKRVFSIASKEESDSLIVAMVVPSKEKSTSLQGTSTRAQKVLVELHSAQ